MGKARRVTWTWSGLTVLIIGQNFKRFCIFNHEFFKSSKKISVKFSRIWLPNVIKVFLRTKKLQLLVLHPSHRIIWTGKIGIFSNSGAFEKSKEFLVNVTFVWRFFFFFGIDFAPLENTNVVKCDDGESSLLLRKGQKKKKKKGRVPSPPNPPPLTSKHSKLLVFFFGKICPSNMQLALIHGRNLFIYFFGKKK